MKKPNKSLESALDALPVLSEADLADLAEIAVLPGLSDADLKEAFPYVDLEKLAESLPDVDLEKLLSSLPRDAPETAANRVYSPETKAALHNILVVIAAIDAVQEDRLDIDAWLDGLDDMDTGELSGGQP